MNYSFRIPNDEASPDLRFEVGFAKAHVFADGLELHPRKGGGYLVPMRDGRTRFFEFDYGLAGVPSLWLDTMERFRLVPDGGKASGLPLERQGPWWQGAQQLLPIVVVLLIGGGALGGLIGGIGVAVNAWLIQGRVAPRLQIVGTVVVTLAGVVLYLALKMAVG